MRTPAGTECPFYFEDYYRGRGIQECRLIARNPQSERWEPKLCAVCPVPGILHANQSPHLALEARVVRRWRFRKRVQIEAYCTRHLVEIPEPRTGCPQCRAELSGSSILSLPVAPTESNGENEAGEILAR